MDAEQRRALESIIRDSERLRDIARRGDYDFLAYLLENVLHEARSVLLGQGGEPPASSKGPGPTSSIVPLISPKSRR